MSRKEYHMLSSLGFIKPGFWELVIILVIVLLLFGAKRLPQIGSAIGQAIKGFRKSVKDLDDKDDDTNKPSA